MNHNTGFQIGYPLDRIQPDSAENSSLRYKIWQQLLRVFAACLLLLVAPLLAAIWIINAVCDRGPFFFKQQRPGTDGRIFPIYKIRTMKVDAEANNKLGTKNTSSDVTTIGRILRKLKIDEFPQLLNIIRGDMAFVGPRPIPLALNDELEKNIPGFAKRYQVKPGLTSIGQICIHDNSLGDELIADWKLRFEGELHYIRNQSISYDLVMISMTACYLFKKLLQK